MCSFSCQHVIQLAACHPIVKITCQFDNTAAWHVAMPLVLVREIRQLSRAFGTDVVTAVLRRVCSCPRDCQLASEMHTAVRQNFARLVCFCTTGVLEHNNMF